MNMSKMTKAGDWSLQPSPGCVCGNVCIHVDTDDIGGQSGDLPRSKILSVMVIFDIYGIWSLQQFFLSSTKFVSIRFEICSIITGADVSRFLNISSLQQRFMNLQL